MPTEATQHQIGIVGHSQAGKTTFIAVLTRAFQDAGWTVVPEGQDGAEQSRYLEWLQSFTHNGFFPPKTTVGSKFERIDLAVRPNPRGDGLIGGARGHGFSLRLFDPAGELFERPDEPGSPRGAELRSAREQLRRCTGALLLLDPQKSPELLRQTWDNVRAGLAPHARTDRIRVAVCFAKADLEAWQRRYRVRSARAWNEISATTSPFVPLPLA